MTIIVLLCVVLALWLIAKICLSGQNLSHYDSSLDHVADDVFNSHPEDSEHNKKALTLLSQARNQALKSKSLFKAIKIAREFADKLSFDLVTDTQFESVSANGVDCEWAISPNSDLRKRIVFFHGGAFLMGSAKGHRKFSDQLSRLANAPVLAVNYRLSPKHSRRAGIKDAQQAYLWALENGPQGQQESSFVLVSGDSAGGNLAHMIASWSNDNAPRKPDCLISFSPSLDQTFSSPILLSNQLSDPVLGQSLSLLTKLVKPIRLWLLLIGMRSNPSSPLISPLFADLSSLPPTLIHASSSEMLLGESIRYTNKAREAGADIKFQVWLDQIHDWQLFNMGYGSANVAWNEVAKFINEHQASTSSEENISALADNIN